MLGAGNDLGEALMFPPQGREEPRVLDGLGIEKVAFDGFGAPKRVGEPVADAQAVAFPYF